MSEVLLTCFYLLQVDLKALAPFNGLKEKLRAEASILAENRGANAIIGGQFAMRTMDNKIAMIFYGTAVKIIRHNESG